MTINTTDDDTNNTFQVGDDFYEGAYPPSLHFYADGVKYILASEHEALLATNADLERKLAEFLAALDHWSEVHGGDYFASREWFKVKRCRAALNDITGEAKSDSKA